MADENTGPMNLDLNLEPLDDSSDDNGPESGSYPSVALSYEDWLDHSFHRIRGFRRRVQRWQPYLRRFPDPPETQNFERENQNETRTGEGSVVAEEKTPEVAKTRESEGPGKIEDAGKNNVDEGSFFDCHICLDLARDPVVTCCGHLFCWACLYRWLHHSDAKECPICKGEVKIKNVTPIYGRVNDNNKLNEPVSNSGPKIPPRPKARRVESWRQVIQRTIMSIPVQEMRTRVGNTFDLSRDFALLQSRNESQSQDIINSVFNRFLTSRGARTEHAPAVASDDAMASNETSPSSLNLVDLNEAAEINFFETNPVGINQEMGLLFDDTDSSMPSIAAGTHAESLMMEIALEIDSALFVSPESSGRRNDASRLADVDSGDSREPPLRRRRLN